MADGELGCVCVSGLGQRRDFLPRGCVDQFPPPAKTKVEGNQDIEAPASHRTRTTIGVSAFRTAGGGQENWARSRRRSRPCGCGVLPSPNSFLRYSQTTTTIWRSDIGSSTTTVSGQPRIFYRPSSRLHRRTILSGNHQSIIHKRTRLSNHFKKTMTVGSARSVSSTSPRQRTTRLHPRASATMNLVKGGGVGSAGGGRMMRFSAMIMLLCLGWMATLAKGERAHSTVQDLIHSI